MRVIVADIPWKVHGRAAGPVPPAGTPPVGTPAAGVAHPADEVSCEPVRSSDLMTCPPKRLRTSSPGAPLRGGWALDRAGHIRVRTAAIIVGIGHTTIRGDHATPPLANCQADARDGSRVPASSRGGCSHSLRTLAPSQSRTRGGGMTAPVSVPSHVLSIDLRQTIWALAYTSQSTLWSTMEGQRKCVSVT
jgi:hypothetical protein